MDSVALGRFVLPAMERLAACLPQLRCAALCTGDGFNVCSIGVTEAQLGKMAALAGSLLTLGDAMLASLAPADAATLPLEVLTLQTGSWITVAVRVAAPGRPLVLMISATQAPLGVLHLRARQSAQEISELLGCSSPPTADRQNKGDTTP
ncbi:MAG: hypothetical protein RJA44_2229 [Pseudomonadota bacterium]